MKRGGSSQGGEAPSEMPQGGPEELFPSNNIRFVIWEVAKLTERVENLSKASDKLSDAISKGFEKQTDDFKERLADLKDDVKSHSDDIKSLDKKVSWVKGAAWVLGIIGVVLTLMIGAILTALARKYIG